MLQSVVSLKLLQRAAGSADKRVVLITNDKALTSLAAGVAMPVAKNLQSRPEIPTLDKVEAEPEDVIDGNQLPVGELAKTAALPADDEIDTTGLSVDDEPAALASSAAAEKKGRRSTKKGAAIPNFDRFRKKLFIFGGLGVLLIAFLIWAIFFAGKATVTITARTNIVNLNQQLKLQKGTSLDADQAVVPFVSKEIKRSASTSFTATGKKDVGERAKGQVTLSKQSQDATTIPAGTRLMTPGGLTYTTDSSVSVPASTFGPGCFPTACAGSVSVGVTAASAGARYNDASGELSGVPEDASAAFSGTTSGGTDKTITVVSQADVNKAKADLAAEDSSKIKAEVKKQFDGNVISIEESFAIEPGEPTSAPAVGQEATAQAKLTAETTYRMIGLARSDLKKVFDAYTKSQISGQTNQKIYESGDDNVKFSEFTGEGDSYAIRAVAVAQVGPNIDEAALAEQLKGKRSGEIQQQIEAVQGVEDVNVRLSPFWVTKAPNNAKKIVITFNVDQK
jgi:hypothetical protein